MPIYLRRLSIAAFSILAVLSVFFLFQLKFSFYLEQFFPEGDEDLAFFRDFTKEFETDINFLLIAVERKEGVFEKKFLEDFHELTLKTRDLPYVLESQSLTMVSYPLKTPFAITAIPAIHLDRPELYEKDKARILQDPRFVNSLISEDAQSMVIAIKTVDTVQLTESKILIEALDELIVQYDFDDHHYLGPAYFQKEMVAMQQREILTSAIVSGILVCFVMFWIFRKPWGIAVALISIGLGMLLFMGLLSAWGRELNAMAALYPVLMIIVGTSDVIHIMSKYVDELRKGKTRYAAIRVTIREIGLATLLTSLTTAIGFATLLTSRISPIRDFGINAAVGVLVAYITVIFFTTAVLSLFKKEQIIKLGRGTAFWEKLMDRCYQLTLDHPRRITVVALGFLALSILGISQITTNYRIESNLPRGEKISTDFLFFEEAYSGFRPLEFAVFVQGEREADDYAVLQQIDRLEQYLETVSAVQSITSITAVYKSINQMFGNNKAAAYQLPDTEKKYRKYKKLVDKVPAQNTNVLISKDRKKARITSRALDLGADTLKQIGVQIDQWILENTDSTVVTFKRTGTGFILDKNTEYVRNNLLQGLGLAIVIVSLLMALLFRNWRMVIVSLIPNIFPLLLAGALLGFLGIELEAGIAIIFAVIFGIAVDDTIHFLGKYKLMRYQGLDMEKALHITFLETGKAICLTSIILFFGFLVMLFSIHPPSVTIGLLISLTLASALIADLFLIPLLLRSLMGEKRNLPPESNVSK